MIDDTIRLNWLIDKDARVVKGQYVGQGEYMCAVLVPDHSIYRDHCGSYFKTVAVGVTPREAIDRAMKDYHL